MENLSWKQVAAWVLRGVLALLILLWAYDGLVEPDMLPRGILAVTVLAGIVLLVIVFQMGPGLRRVVLANAAGFVVFACNVTYIAIKSQKPISLFVMTLAAGLVGVPWVVRFSIGIRRLMAAPRSQPAPMPVVEPAPVPAPGEPSPELAAPIPAATAAPALARPERPRYRLPSQRPPAKRRTPKPKPG